MGPIAAVISCYVNIVNFSGRARRAEYWWFFLFLVLAGIGLQMSVTVGMLRDPAFLAAVQDPVRLQAWFKQNEDLWQVTGYMTVGYILLAWLPQLSVTVRRLHDTNRSGWFIFMPFIASVAAIVAAVMLAATTGGTAGMSLFWLIMAVPLIANIWFLVVLCLPGTHGTNRFSPDPVKGRKRRAPDHPAFAPAMEPEDRAAHEAARRAEIAAYYRKNVAPKARRV